MSRVPVYFYCVWRALTQDEDQSVASITSPRPLTSHPKNPRNPTQRLTQSQQTRVPTHLPQVTMELLARLPA